MIVVGGFNTAIDTVADADEIRAGAVIRLTAVASYPGGKGVHVAQTCALLGEPVRLVGLIDDGQAALFARVLAERAVEFYGVRMRGRLRTCYAIRDARGTITELLEPGPSVDADTIAQLEQTFLSVSQAIGTTQMTEAIAATEAIGATQAASAIQTTSATRMTRVTQEIGDEAASVAVLTGSVPAPCASDRYGVLVTRLRDRVPHIILDTSGDALVNGLAAGPTIVKPNREEASRLVGREIVSVAAAIEAAREIARRGVRSVIISLGAEGARASWEGRLARVEIPPQVAVNAVGSGDCFVGGLAVALARRASAEEALRLAAACGAANVLVREPGRCHRADVERLTGEVRVAWM